jgi:hypothetical protein
MTATSLSAGPLKNPQTWVPLGTERFHDGQC